MTVKSALWNRRIDTPGSLFDLAGAPRRRRRRPRGGRARRRRCRCGSTCSCWCRRRCASRTTWRGMVASADLTLRGTYDRPVLARPRRHRARRGDVRRAPLPHHARHDRLHEPDAHRAVLRRRGRDERARAGPDLSRDRRASPARPSSCGRRSAPIRRCRPPTCSRCCSATCARGTQDVGPSCARCRTRTRRRPTSSPRARRRRSTAPISSEVGKVVEQTFGVDTFQLTPSLIDPYSQQTSRLNPTARLTIGKRISDRVYLTFSRSLGTIDQRSDRAARDTTRAIGSRGFCRATRTRRPTRSSSA